MPKKTKELKGTSAKKAKPGGFVAEIEKLIEGLPGHATGASISAVRNIRLALERAATQLVKTAEGLDSIKTPSTVFDPSNPKLVGRFIALALIAQDRVPISSIDRFYGAGIYAIYYKGQFEAYRTIQGSEHPIYVGKADPDINEARTPKDQGVKLWGRLNEHAKSIEKAGNLSLSDFECRFLVVASGYQKSAEEYLINLFKPIWNSEVNLVFGIGKHGDSAKTRGNKRSPWDTLHPGRKWAAATSSDQRSVVDIGKALAVHFRSTKPYTSREDIFSRFMSDMRQLPTISSSSSEEKGS